MDAGKNNGDGHAYDVEIKALHACNMYVYELEFSAWAAMLSDTLLVRARRCAISKMGAM